MVLQVPTRDNGPPSTAILIDNNRGQYGNQAPWGAWLTSQDRASRWRLVAPTQVGGWDYCSPRRGRSWAAGRSGGQRLACPKDPRQPGNGAWVLGIGLGRGQGTGVPKAAAANEFNGAIISGPARRSKAKNRSQREVFPVWRRAKTTFSAPAGLAMAGSFRRSYMTVLVEKGPIFRFCRWVRPRSGSAQKTAPGRKYGAPERCPGRAYKQKVIMNGCLCNGMGFADCLG